MNVITTTNTRQLTSIEIRDPRHDDFRAYTLEVTRGSDAVCPITLIEHDFADGAEVSRIALSPTAAKRVANLLRKTAQTPQTGVAVETRRFTNFAPGDLSLGPCPEPGHGLITLTDLGDQVAVDLEDAPEELRAVARGLQRAAGAVTGRIRKAG